MQNILFCLFKIFEGLISPSLARENLELNPGLASEKLVSLWVGLICVNYLELNLGLTESDLVLELLEKNSVKTLGLNLISPKQI
jgi:hypothetical protein